MRRYREYFPADQILVMLTEDLRDEPAAVLRRIERFLGLAAYDYQHLDRHYHVSSNRRMNNRPGDAMERHDRPSRLSSWAIPHQLQDRVLTKPAGPAADAVPPSAIDRIREVLGRRPGTSAAAGRSRPAEVDLSGDRREPMITKRR